MAQALPSTSYAALPAGSGGGRGCNCDATSRNVYKLYRLAEARQPIIAEKRRGSGVRRRAKARDSDPFNMDLGSMTPDAQMKRLRAFIGGLNVPIGLTSKQGRSSGSPVQPAKKVY